ncbi:MAG TPA: hypothetical protein VFQ61_30390, partial [Polyangiaceae bacterium]|nr:hypothetical protein [Polyangiaceae bacterium]
MLRAFIAAKSNLQPTPQAALSSVLRELGVQDWLVLLYLVGLNIGVLQGQRGPGFTTNLARTLGLLCFSIVGLWLCRSGLLRDGW